MRSIKFLLFLMIMMGVNFTTHSQITSGEKNNHGMEPSKTNDGSKNDAINYPEITKREGKGLSLPIPPNEHPRLFLRKKDISILAQKINHPLTKDKWNGIVKNANKTTTGVLNPEIKNNLDMDVLDAIESKAFLHVFQNEAYFGKQAVEAIINLNNTINFDDKKPDVTRDVGAVILATSLVYDWCHDLINAEQKFFLINKMEALATKLEIKWPYLVQNSVTGHGVESQVSRDMLAFGIATYNEKPEIYNRISGRIMAEIIPARNFFYQSSSHHQGSSYGPYRFKWEMFTTLLYDRMGYPNIVDKTQGTVPYQWIYTRRADGQLLRNGDDFVEQFTDFRKYWSIKGLIYAASYYNDPILMHEALIENTDNDHLFDFLLINPFLKPADGLSALPLSRYFPSPLGSMIARTSWEQGMSSNAVVVEMKIGTYNFVNHQHLDAGSFQIYHKGPLAVQSGIYQGTTGGYGSMHFKNYSQRTIAHNSMLIYDPNEKHHWHGQEIINDGGQRYPNGAAEAINLDDLLQNDYKTGEVLAHDFGPDKIHPEYTYIKGELAAAYSSKIKSFKRSFVFLNLMQSETPAALIVFDRVKSAKKKYKKTWLMHCVEEPNINANVTIIKRTTKGYNGQITNTTFLPSSENVSVKKIGGKDKEFSVNGVNFSQKIIAENNSADQAEWRLEVSPIKEAKCDLFFNVLEIGDVTSETNNAVKKSTKLETKSMIGTKIDDRMVFFSKTGKLIKKSMTLENSNEGITKVLLTDLKNGKWKITASDTKTEIKIVKSDENLIYFTLEKGRFKIEMTN